MMMLMADADGGESRPVQHREVNAVWVMQQKG